MSHERVNLPALVALWARQTDELARGTVSFDDDFEAMIDVRHEIAKRLRVRPASAETRDLLAEFDDVFRGATVEGPACAYGDARAAEEGWTKQREWYLWRRVADRPFGSPSPSESS